MSFIKKANFTNKKRVICEVLREMYDIIAELDDNEELVELLEEANTMAKKMNDKLYEYAYNVTEQAEENLNYENSFRLRQNRVHSE